MKRVEMSFEEKVLEARNGCGLIVGMVVFSMVVASLITSSEHVDHVSTEIVTTEVRIDRLEHRQRELDDRINALSSSLRAAVRPIGWDMPMDGGR